MSNKKQKEILKIEGMTCANCALGIKKHLDKNGVQNVNINFASAEASFTKDQQYNFEKVKKLIQAIGYNAKRISEKEQGPGLSSIEKKFFFTLFFTIPLFSHMFLPEDSILQNALLQFLLCLPVFFVGVWHFGKSGFIGIPQRIGLYTLESSEPNHLHSACF